MTTPTTHGSAPDPKTGLPSAGGSSGGGWRFLNTPDAVFNTSTRESRMQALIDQNRELLAQIAELKREIEGMKRP